MADFQSWERSVPEAITKDQLWRMRVYRLALFAAYVGWADVTKPGRDHRTRGLSDQLCRALGSISANIAEGYSRGSGKERAHFYEYALGAAGESRDWYYKGGQLLGDEVVGQRMELLSQIIRLLLTMVPDQRHRTLREEPLPYSPDDPSE